MAIEKGKITDKLKEEGIDEKFGKGVSFDTEEELNSWVDDIKTLTVKPKSIEDYTSEEIEAILNNPQPTAKGLQSAMDKKLADAKKRLEDKYKKGDPTKTDPPKTEIPEELKNEIEELKNLREEFKADKAEREKSKKKESFNVLFDQYSKGLDDDDKRYVRAVLNVESKEEDIKKAVSEYKASMAIKGFKDYGSSSSNKKDKEVSDKETEDSIKRILEKKNKK